MNGGSGTVNGISGGINVGVNEGVNEPIKENVPKENLAQKSSEKSSEKILSEIEKNNEITIEELSSKLGQTTRSVEKILAKLKEEGQLKREGGRKLGHWVVIKKSGK